MTTTSQAAGYAESDLAELRAGFPRWEIFHDAFRFLLVARLKADPAIRVTADEHHELRQKLARRENRLDLDEAGGKAPIPPAA